AVYSTFLQRAYDQIIEDVALQNLPVIFCVDRAGIVGEDGATHQGIFDVSFLNTVPNLAILAPKDAAELKDMLAFGLRSALPLAIRYPKGEAPDLPAKSPEIELGKAEVLSEGRDFAVIALGSMVGPSWEAGRLLQGQGLSGYVINARFAKPLDRDLFGEIAGRVKYIFTVEEGIIDGGFGSAVENILGRQVEKIGLPDTFICHGKRRLLLEKYGLTAARIADKIKARCLK
ncbi:MAG: transketolase C-terminal domain-containing protein, partial [Candidatus Omnitrophota bacterium]